MPGRWDRDSLKQLDGIDKDYDCFSYIFGEILIDNYLRLIRATPKSVDWKRDAENYKDQDSFIRDHNCMFVLEDMADEDEEYNVAFYNMVDYCQNKNIPRTTMEDMVWSYVKGDL